MAAFRFNNVMEAIAESGDDAGFVPMETKQFQPTDAPAGSQAKIEELRRRVELGLPLWHPNDRADFTDWEDAAAAGVELAASKDCSMVLAEEGAPSHLDA